MSAKNRVYRTPPRNRNRASMNAYEASLMLGPAHAAAKKHALKPSSWWTAHAAPESSRAEFVAAVNQRALLREQKYATNAGIAEHRDPR